MGLKSTLILHDVRRALGLNWMEYGLCDSVYHLSNNPKAPVPGWCNQTRENMATEIGVSKKTIQNMVKKLTEQGLIEMNEKGQLRTTLAWYESAVKGGEKFAPPIPETGVRGEKFAPQGVKNLHGGGEKFAPKYKNINIEIESVTGHTEKSKPFPEGQTPRERVPPRINVATSTIASEPVSEDPFKFIFDFFGIRPSPKMEYELMKLSEKDIRTIRDHLPVLKVQQDGRELKYKKKLHNYLRERTWETEMPPGGWKSPKAMSTGFRQNIQAEKETIDLLGPGYVGS